MYLPGRGKPGVAALPESGPVPRRACGRDSCSGPSVLAEQMIAPLAHRTLGSYRGVTRPIVFGRTPGPAPFAAPVFDQDTAAVRAAAAGTTNDD